VSEDAFKSLELAIMATVSLERIAVLANEYRAKTITAERFAERAVEFLLEYDAQAKAKTP